MSSELIKRENFNFRGQASRDKSEWEIMSLSIFKQNKEIVGVKNE